MSTARRDGANRLVAASGVSEATVARRMSAAHARTERLRNLADGDVEIWREAALNAPAFCVVLSMCEAVAPVMLSSLARHGPRRSREGQGEPAAALLVPLVQGAQP